MKYSDTTTPDSYVCADCGAKGVKLWRLYNTFLSHQHLRCATCACKDQMKDPDLLRENGTYPFIYRGEIWHYSDQIGNLVPAVPTEEEDTYWGYSSVPGPGADWWDRLPLTAQAAKKIEL